MLKATSEPESETLTPTPIPIPAPVIVIIIIMYELDITKIKLCSLNWGRGELKLARWLSFDMAVSANVKGGCSRALGMQLS